MRHVTPFTAVRGLIATAVILLLAGMALVILPAILVILAVVLACCILQSESWRESWEMFRGGTRELLGDVAALFRTLGELWVTDDGPWPRSSRT